MRGLRQIVKCFCLLIAVSASTQGQIVTSSDSLAQTKALSAIYGFHFEDYKKCISALSEKDKNIKHLLNIFYLRWKEIPIAYSPHSEEYHHLLLNSVAELEKDNGTDIYTSYFKICSYLFLSEYHSWLGENWAALKYAQKAYHLVIVAMDKQYSQPEFLFIKGLYQYYIEYYKQKSLFYKAALIPLRSGDRKEGLNILKQCTLRPSIVQTEARIFVAHILLHLDNKPSESLPVTKSLIEDYPGNLKFIELHTESLIKCKKYTEALPFVEILQNQTSFYYSGPGNFFRGLIEENHFKNKTKAKIAYQKCIEKEFKPIEYFQKNASQRLKQIIDN